MGNWKGKNYFLHAGVEQRKKSALKRRVYSVPGPNALWHMDGNHKLIRYVQYLDRMHVLYGHCYSVDLHNFREIILVDSVHMMKSSQTR